jgi:cytochrome c oxidase cbb3-type subunit 3
MVQGVGFAQDAEKTAPVPEESNSLLWALGILIASLVLFITYVSRSFRSAGTKAQGASSFAAWWASLDQKFFTKAVPVEKEADHLLDHDYDGIKELDNSLPPWWKYGFYFTVGVAIIYVLHFHVWNTGLNPEQEYNKEMRIAAAQVEEYRKKAGETVDEKTVKLADATGIAEGKKIYQSSCFACHGANGEGGVGPNLTDNYWMHGGSINDVFKTIKYGVPEKGMQAWEKTYSPSQIRNIASYIKSIVGTQPANGKAPQGDEYKEDVKAPSSPTAKL